MVSKVSNPVMYAEKKLMPSSSLSSDEDDNDIDDKSIQRPSINEEFRQKVYVEVGYNTNV